MKDSQLKKILLEIYEKAFKNKYFVSLVYWKQAKNNKLKIMTPNQTLKYIEQHECSISRFGEGEFELIMWKDMDLGFQERSPELSNKLLNVLNKKNENLLICIPYALNTTFGRTMHSRMFWYHWCNRNNQRDKILDIIRSNGSGDYLFGDTQISRPYIAWENARNADRMFPKIKNLWKNKDIIIVEGEKTRLGVGNDLLVGAKTVRRVLAPPTNAFDYYDELLDTIKEKYQGELIILALGPTATVLAADLTEVGIRALDIGHLDIEYEWYLKKAKNHEIIQGKFTNEAEGGNVVRSCVDEQYVKQIIARVGCT